MKNININDNLREDTKSYKLPMIIGYLGTVLIPLLFLLPSKSENFKNSIIQVSILTFVFLYLAVYFTYAYIHSKKYNINITYDEIEVISIIKNYKINTNEIKSYTVNKYRKTNYYVFRVMVNGKNYKFLTKYLYEVESLIKSHIK